MDITKFVVGERSKAFLYGDYASYRSSLSQKLRNCRKHLGQETKNRAKFQKKAGVTAEQIGGKSEYENSPRCDNSGPSRLTALDTSTCSCTRASDHGPTP